MEAIEPWPCDLFKDLSKCLGDSSRFGRSSVWEGKGEPKTDAPYQTFANLLLPHSTISLLLHFVPADRDFVDMATGKSQVQRLYLAGRVSCPLPHLSSATHSLPTLSSPLLSLFLIFGFLYFYMFSLPDQNQRRPRQSLSSLSFDLTRKS